MSRRLIYLFPCLMDISVAIVLFASPTILASRDESAVVVAGSLGVWGLLYMISGYAMGHFVSEKNAVHFLLASCIGFVVASFAFAMAKDTTFGVYVMTGLFGIVNAAFFVPFQVFMKRIDQDTGKSVCYSAAFYTFAWSMGIAMGRYIGGYLADEYGWTICFLGIAPPAVVTAIGILYFKRLANGQKNTQPATDNVPTPQTMHYDSMPDLAWMGWVFAGLGIIGVAIIGAVFPKVANVLEIELIYQGSAMFVLFLMQSLTAFTLRNGKTWMYQPTPMLGFACVGALGMLLFGFAQNALTFHIAAALFGIFAGANFVYFVFHSLVHPERSAKYVSINETVVGLTGILGPLLGGIVAYLITLSSPFFMMGLAMLIAGVVQVSLHARHSQKVTDLLAAHAD